MMKVRNEKYTIRRIIENEKINHNNRSEYYTELKYSLGNYYKYVCDLIIPNQHSNDWDCVKDVLYKTTYYGGDYLLFKDYNIHQLIDYGRFIEDFNLHQLNNEDELTVEEVIKQFSIDDYRYWERCNQSVELYRRTFNFNYYKIVWMKYLTRNYKVKYSEEKIKQHLKIIGIKKQTILPYIKSLLGVYNLLRVDDGFPKIKKDLLNTFTYDLWIYDNGSFDIKIYSKDYIKEDYNVILDNTEEYNEDFRKKFFNYEDNSNWRNDRNTINDYTEKQILDFNKECISSFKHKYSTTQKYIVSKTMKGELIYNVVKRFNQYRLIIFELNNLPIHSKIDITDTTINKQIISEYTINN